MRGILQQQWYTCFNPRPHRGAGATDEKAANAQIKQVSILARTEARALLDATSTIARCQVVSILARTEARALPAAALAVALAALMFQSSPAPRRGRYRSTRQLRAPHDGFNPRPHRGAGATRLGRKCGQGISVSILARTEARALPHQGVRSSTCM